MLLDQIALVLRLQIASPAARELELASRLFEYPYAFGVVEAHEVVVENELQTLQQPLVPHLVHKFEILAAVVERIADEVFEEVLGKIHVVVKLVECHFGLDHPELGKMSRRVGVLGAERRTERIDLSERQGAQLAFELTRYGQAARLAEEVLRIVDASLVGAGRVVHIERGHVEHRAGTLAVRSGNQRRVQIVESVLVEIFVDRESHCVAYAQYGTESIGARTQIGYVAQEF